MFITQYICLFTHERVPLEMLTINGCSDITEKCLWNLGRFDMTLNDDSDLDGYKGYY